MQAIKHVGQISKVLVEGPREDNDVINVDKTACPNQSLKELLHVVLERAWGV
jgi:hypothetical protein